MCARQLNEDPFYVASMTEFLASTQRDFQLSPVEILGRQFIVLPGVFSPAYYAETAFFTGHVVELVDPGTSYLDLGCGAGVTAVSAALKGAKVTALDINPAAVENTRRNASLHGVEGRVRVLQSDIYSALREGERFDTIYWNVPFGYRRPGTSLTVLEESVFDVGYRKNREFVLHARSHCVVGGQILMGISSTLGSRGAIEAFAAEAGVNFVEVARTLDPDAPFELWLELLRAEL